jgi:hypothetical protein
MEVIDQLIIPERKVWFAGQGCENLAMKREMLPGLHHPIFRPARREMKVRR